MIVIILAQWSFWFACSIFCLTSLLAVNHEIRICQSFLSQLCSTVIKREILIVHNFANALACTGRAISAKLVRFPVYFVWDEAALALSRGYVNCCGKYIGKWAPKSWAFALTTLWQGPRWWVLAFLQLHTLGWPDRGYRWDSFIRLIAGQIPNVEIGFFFFGVNLLLAGLDSQDQIPKKKRMQVHSLDLAWSHMEYLCLIYPPLLNCASSWSVFLLRERGLACQAKRICWVIPAIDKTGVLRFLGFSYLERLVGSGHWANATPLAKTASIRESIEIGE